MIRLPAAVHGNAQIPRSRVVRKCLVHHVVLMKFFPSSDFAHQANQDKYDGWHAKNDQDHNSRQIAWFGFVLRMVVLGANIVVHGIVETANKIGL